MMFAKSASHAYCSTSDLAPNNFSAVNTLFKPNSKPAVTIAGKIGMNNHPTI